MLYNKATDYKQHNLLLDFFQLIDHSLILYFYKNELFITISLQSIFISNRKCSVYTSFKILYHLGLLERIEPTSNKKEYTKKLSKVYYGQPNKHTINKKILSFIKKYYNPNNKYLITNENEEQMTYQN